VQGFFVTFFSIIRKINVGGMDAQFLQNDSKNISEQNSNTLPPLPTEYGRE
jgi:hypothetical protein